RLHGIGAREPWSYGPAAERAAMAALELRYRLLPYLWRAVQQASTTGLPVQRAMALACPGEPASWAFEHQFFCGADLLVAPCLDPCGRVRVYLPEGEWCRFPSGGHFAGGRTHELVLGLDELAVFARRGTGIPLGPPVRHTGELGVEPVVSETWHAA
ncbi:MAG: alpha-D-xyloside xylohydrolase, partial [Pseudomonadota bacterium]|nr:alpha-D-xyloside xylohydrolase [Pseudomonadota bacterium]